MDTGYLEKLSEAKESIYLIIRSTIDYDKWKKERKKEFSQARKKLETNASGPWDSITKARYVLFLREKDGNICPGCHTEISHPALDHVIPLTSGGDNLVDNLRLLCRSCNSRKGTLPWEEFLEKQKINSIVREIRYLCMNNFGPKKLSQLLNIKIKQASLLLNNESNVFSLSDLNSFLEKIKTNKPLAKLKKSGKEDL